MGELLKKTVKEKLLQLHWFLLIQLFFLHLSIVQGMLFFFYHCFYFFSVLSLSYCAEPVIMTGFAGNPTTNVPGSVRRIYCNIEYEPMIGYESRIICKVLVPQQQH